MENVLSNSAGQVEMNKATKDLRNESFRNVIIMNDATVEVVKRLIKEAFFNIRKEEYWKYPMQDELIKAALNLGFTELAAELTLYTE